MYEPYTSFLEYYNRIRGMKQIIYEKKAGLEFLYEDIDFKYAVSASWLYLLTVYRLYGTINGSWAKDMCMINTFQKGFARKRDRA